MEGADVERVAHAQRGAGGAGRERLVHVDEVEAVESEEIFERARDVDRHCRGAAELGRRERERCADAEHVRRRRLAPVRTCGRVDRSLAAA